MLIKIIIGNLYLLNGVIFWKHDKDLKENKNLEISS
jgi:hypothetical protein